MLGKIRKAKQGDLKLIFDSWMKSFKKSDMTAKMPMKLYNERIEHLILNLLKSGAQITLLVDSNDDDFILAWACHGLLGSIPVLHYVWTKSSLREHGCATELLNSVGIGSLHNFIYSSRAPMARLLEKKSKTAKVGTYDPYLQIVRS